MPTAIAVALALAGCGGSEEEKVEEALQASVQGLVDQDAEKSCAVLSRETKREAESEARGRPCVEIYRQLSQSRAIKSLLPNFENAKVEDVKINGERATATVVSDSGEKADPTMLQKEDGEWKLAQIAPALLR